MRASKTTKSMKSLVIHKKFSLQSIRFPPNNYPYVRACGINLTGNISGWWEIHLYVARV